MLKWKRPESRENLEKSSERRETGDRTTDYRVHHRHLIFNIASRILLLLFYPFGMWTTRTIYSLQNIYDGVLEKQAPKRWDSVLEKHTRERYNHPVYCLDIPPPLSLCTWSRQKPKADRSLAYLKNRSWAAWAVVNSHSGTLRKGRAKEWKRKLLMSM